MIYTVKDLWLEKRMAEDVTKEPELVQVTIPHFFGMFFQERMLACQLFVGTH